MDLIKFSNTVEPTNFNIAVPIEGYLSVSWIERYRKEGEFTIEARLSSGLRELLPLGSFISHVDTYEVMVVEDHYIKEPADEDPIIKITGRGIQVLLEQRQVGASINWTSTVMPLTPFVLASNYVFSQALALIQTHAEYPIAWDDYDDIPFVKSVAPYGPGTLVSLEDREIPFGDVHSATLDILGVEDLGLKFVRKHDWNSKYHPGWNLDVNSLFWIHEGEDLSGTVVFSADSGEVDSAEYLWSNKTHKNAAFVYGEHRQMMVEYNPIAPATHENRRVVVVDASDIDKDWDTATTGERTTMENKMERRGRDAIENANQIALTSVDISREKNYRYRESYDIGDIVTVRGSYGEIARMRVVEFAELEDQESFVAYPTLQILDI